jgi:hypothetical protein
MSTATAGTGLMIKSSQNEVQSTDDLSAAARGAFGIGAEPFRMSGSDTSPPVRCEAPIGSDQSEADIER